MRDFNDLYFFAAVVKNEGFSAAARVLGIPKSRISRRIANLEEQLGVRLLERSTRRLSVTEIGRDVYRHARAMMDEVEAVDEVALRMRSEPQGLVRVSCPVGVQRAISTALPTLLKRYPLLRIQFLITNRAVDVIEESVDVAVRIRERLDTDGELANEAHRYQSPDTGGASKRYKEDMVNPIIPEDLRRFPIIHATERLGPVSWQLVGPEGRVSTVQVEPRVSAGDFAMLLQAALEGVGLALLPEIDCQPALQAKQLVRVLPDWGIADGMIHLVFPSRRGMLPGVRAVIEFLATTLQATIGSK